MNAPTLGRSALGVSKKMDGVHESGYFSFDAQHLHSKLRNGRA
jgi:hypothetical protein